MHSVKLRARAHELYAAGRSKSEIARQLSVARSTVNYWCRTPVPTDDARDAASRCFRCGPATHQPEQPEQYVYLLGQYLGDGHLVTTAKVPVLRITCTECYPDIIDECRHAMLVTLAQSVQIVQRTGCVNVQSYSTHWPCLLPQHGPGPKHRRPIVFAGWQQELVETHPQQFLRGLIHSDGCRVMNRVTVRGKEYSYPRYIFSNKSLDILKMCGDALNLVGAQWRHNRWDNISVAKKDSVALLDEFIGPKG